MSLSSDLAGRQLSQLTGKELTRLSFSNDLDAEERGRINGEIQRRQESGAVGGTPIPALSEGALRHPDSRSSSAEVDDAEMTHVIVSHIDVPFTDLMVLLFKLTLAAIPVGIVFGGAWFLLHALLA